MLARTLLILSILLVGCKTVEEVNEPQVYEDVNVTIIDNIGVSYE